MLTNDRVNHLFKVTKGTVERGSPFPVSFKAKPMLTSGRSI